MTKITELTKVNSPLLNDLLVLVRNGTVTNSIEFNNMLERMLHSEASLIVLDEDTNLEQGTGLMFWAVPDIWDDTEIVSVHFAVHQPSTSGSNEIQVRNVTKDVNVLSSLPSAGVGQYNSFGSSPSILNGMLDRGDRLRIDINSAGADTQGLIVMIKVKLL